MYVLLQNVSLDKIKIICGKGSTKLKCCGKFEIMDRSESCSRFEHRTKSKSYLIIIVKSQNLTIWPKKENCVKL